MTTNDRTIGQLAGEPSDVGRAFLIVARHQLAERAQRIRHCV